MPKKKANSKRRAKAKINKKLKVNKEHELMIETLESAWKTKVKYTCLECLKTAYMSVKNNTNGYITDEELIKSSNNTLKHK